MRKDYPLGLLRPVRRSASEIAAREEPNRKHPPIEGHELRKAELSGRSRARMKVTGPRPPGLTHLAGDTGRFRQVRHRAPHGHLTVFEPISCRIPADYQPAPRCRVAPIRPFTQEFPCTTEGYSPPRWS